MVPKMPMSAPQRSSAALTASRGSGTRLPSFRASKISARVYMMGGKMNIILEPKIAPETEPTTPMSVYLEASNETKSRSAADTPFVLLTKSRAALFGNLFVMPSTRATNQFRMDKKISGKLAKTEEPKAMRARVPRGSLVENEFKANDADWGPKR